MKKEIKSDLADYKSKCEKTLTSYDQEGGWKLIDDCLQKVEDHRDDPFPFVKIEESAKVTSGYIYDS